MCLCRRLLADNDNVAQMVRLILNQWDHMTALTENSMLFPDATM